MKNSEAKSETPILPLLTRLLGDGEGELLIYKGELFIYKSLSCPGLFLPYQSL